MAFLFFGEREGKISTGRTEILFGLFVKKLSIENILP